MWRYIVKVITICGSLSFKEEMMIIAEKLALEGNCILTPVYPVKNFSKTDTQLEKLKEAHFKRIEPVSYTHLTLPTIA